jgi:glyoxylase-like metal-dependent hydrolase (beta-lactamase superfamily II)
VIEQLRHEDVTQLRCSTPWSRLAGYTVSLFQVRDILIDSGFSQVGPQVEGWVRARAPAGCVISHYHEDHAGNAAHLGGLGLPLWLAPETRHKLAHPDPIRMYRRVIWGASPALVVAVREFEPSRLVIIPTPGHSADHHAVWDPATATLFGGDLFLGVKVSVAHPGENPRVAVASLRRVLTLEPRRLFDAHRGPVTDPVGALRAKLAWMEDAIGSIDELARQGWSDRRIRDRVLGRELPVGYFSGHDYSRLNFVVAVRRGVNG